MSIFRTIALFVYLFGYMIVHYSVLCKAERALAAGDTETVRQLVKTHIPHWSKGILNVTGVRLSAEGLDNIPQDGPCWPASMSPTASSPRKSWEKFLCSTAG